MRVNLIASKRNRRMWAINWTRVIISSLIGCIIFAIGFNFFLMQNKANVLKQEVNSIEEQLEVYLPKQKEYLNLNNKLEKLQNEPEIIISNYLWDQSLIELGYIIPPGSEITGMEINTGDVIFNGKASESKKLLQITERMKSSPLFEAVTITKLNKQKDINFNIEAHLAEGGN